MKAANRKETGNVDPSLLGSPFFSAADEKPISLGHVGLGGSCFLILSGPSTRQLDLSLLNRRGIYTVAVNNAASIWRPSAWLCVDPPRKFHESIWFDPAVMKFCPAHLLQMRIRRRLESGQFENILKPDGSQMVPADCPNVIGYNRNLRFNVETWLGESTVNWGVSHKIAKQIKRTRIRNVMLAAVKIVYLLGFRQVFLLGCDFDMVPGDEYGFPQGKQPGGVAGNNKSYLLLQGMFGDLRPQFDRAGFKLWNCNAASKLTVFPFVEFGEAIQMASGHVPQDPLDTRDYYYR